MNGKTYKAAIYIYAYIYAAHVYNVYRIPTFRTDK